MYKEHEVFVEVGRVGMVHSLFDFFPDFSANKSLPYPWKRDLVISEFLYVTKVQVCYKSS